MLFRIRKCVFEIFRKFTLLSNSLNSLMMKSWMPFESTCWANVQCDSTSHCSNSTSACLTSDSPAALLFNSYKSWKTLLDKSYLKNWGFNFTFNSLKFWDKTVCAWRRSSRVTCSMLVVDRPVIFRNSAQWRSVNVSPRASFSTGMKAYKVKWDLKCLKLWTRSQCRGKEGKSKIPCVDQFDSSANQLLAIYPHFH